MLQWGPRLHWGQRHKVLCNYSVVTDNGVAASESHGMNERRCAHRLKVPTHPPGAVVKPMLAGHSGSYIAEAQKQLAFGKGRLKL